MKLYSMVRYGIYAMVYRLYITFIGMVWYGMIWYGILYCILCCGVCGVVWYAML